MMETCFGRVQAATSSQISVVVDADEDNVKTYEGRSYHVCQVGSYVRVPHLGADIIGVVSEAVQRDVLARAGEQEVTIGSTRRELTVQLVGALADGRFKRGVVSTPCIDEEVHVVTGAQMETIFRGGGTGTVEVGTLSTVPDLAAFVDADLLFSHHVAVVGGTGSGKSSVVAATLQQAAALPSTRVILLDLHNEYRDAFGEDSLVVPGEMLKLPYWLLNFEELQDLLVDVADHSAHNQVMQLKELTIACKRSENSDIARLSVDSPVYFDLLKVKEGFEELNTQMVPSSTSRGEKQGPFYGDFTRLLARLESRMADVRYDFMFCPTGYSSSTSLCAYLRQMLGYGDPSKKITVVDLSGIPSEVLGVVVSVLCRVIFDFQFWFPEPTARPVVLALEEAHNYVPRAGVGRGQAARASVERIAKEGRKYGLGLALVSQRPSEISETVLAQCGTFVALRLTNPSDQGYVKALVPDALGEIMSALPALERGEAILSGEAVVLPMRVQMTPANPFPLSHDAKVWTEWSEEKGELGVEAVVEQWQHQRRSTSAGIT